MEVELNGYQHTGPEVQPDRVRVVLRATMANNGILC